MDMILIHVKVVSLNLGGSFPNLTMWAWTLTKDLIQDPTKHRAKGSSYLTRPQRRTVLSLGIFRTTNTEQGACRTTF